MDEINSANEIIDILIDNVKKLLYPEEFIEFDLKFSKSELFTLFLAERKKSVTMTELSEYINAPMSTSTGIVDRLIKKRLIERGRSEEDRRIVVIRLTAEGLALIAKIKGYLTNIAERVLLVLSPEEKAILNKLMSRLPQLIGSGRIGDDIRLKDDSQELKSIHIY